MLVMWSSVNSKIEKKRQPHPGHFLSKDIERMNPTVGMNMATYAAGAAISLTTLQRVSSVSLRSWYTSCFLTVALIS